MKAEDMYSMGLGFYPTTKKTINPFTNEIKAMEENNKNYGKYVIQSKIDRMSVEEINKELSKVRRK